MLSMERSSGVATISAVEFTSRDEQRALLLRADDYGRCKALNARLREGWRIVSVSPVRDPEFGGVFLIVVERRTCGDKPAPIESRRRFRSRGNDETFGSGLFD
jgi:hypothetical protein